MQACGRVHGSSWCSDGHTPTARLDQQGKSLARKNFSVMPLSGMAGCAWLGAVWHGPNGFVDYGLSEDELEVCAIVDKEKQRQLRIIVVEHHYLKGGKSWFEAWVKHKHYNKQRKNIKK
ncbi:hypothetical protein TIFTF001_033258 [Ficus carica]|uniref:Uncharacterized protein n=1 Tax=Ficus carica TaxID=3494 RepID=A0AA88J6W1_FICCA|nr:hypothetical protein TIFTF001_033258 [Ficus carica]